MFSDLNFLAYLICIKKFLFLGKKCVTCMQGYMAADMQALHFAGSNPQSTNQPQGSVPVWDFL